MNSDFLLTMLNYLDFYGTSFTFYIDGNRKLYTPLGGILSIISIIIGTTIFVYINLDDFLHNNPSSTTSTERENFSNIKFGDEKIWIPWRLRDFGGQTINHTDKLYPIIYYYHGTRNNSLKKLEISYEFINYKLCNETSMGDYSNLYTIDININNLYCIDMEDLDIGGSWEADFLNLITFDLYTCKNGIDYNDNNINCTTYAMLEEMAGKNDSFEFEIYYPAVQYQPIDKNNPIFIRYYNYFYHLSKYSNKIDRLYLQQYILKDDLGWFGKNEKIYSNWGCESLNGDSYATGNKKDLMNEGSSSRLYSFNIYLKSEVFYFNRSYKKIYIIIAEGLPIVNVIFIIFGIVARVFKISSGNKKLTELLFENLKKKKIKISNEQFNSLKIYQKNSELKKKSPIFVGELNPINVNKKNVEDTSYVKFKNVNEISSVNLNYRNSEKKYLGDIERKNSLENKPKRKPKVISRNSVNNFPINKSDISKSLTNNNNFEDIFSIKSKDLSYNINLGDKNNKAKNNDEITIKPNKILRQKTQYIKRTLFPYRYYLYSICIKNIDISKKSFFLTKKFMVVYNFVCQLIDISAYLILQKEFEIMKNAVLVEKYKDLLENRKKINVNEVYFNYNMKECLNTKKFSILGKINKSNLC